MRRLLGIFYGLIFSSLTYAQNCNPIGLLAGAVDLKDQSVQLVSLGLDYSKIGVQINTINCNQLKKVISEDKYQQLQMSSAGGQPFFAVVFKSAPPKATYCLIDVLDADQVKFLDGAKGSPKCDNSELIATSTNIPDYPIVYLSKKTFEQVMRRAPASKGKSNANKK